MAEVKKPAASKTIQMQTKPTYEQLEKICQRQQQQITAFAQELNRLSNAYKRLDYLFKVVELEQNFSDDFYQSCVNEIEEMMKLPEKEDNKEEDGAEAE